MSRLRWLSIAVLFVQSAALAAELPGLKPFAGSELVRFVESAPDAVTLFVEGPVDRIGRTVRTPSSRHVPGRALSAMWRMPAQLTPREAFDFFVRQVPKVAGAYTCSGLSCGRSTIWANDIFGIAALTGIDSDQFYLATPYATEGKDYLLSLYVVRRGNRAVYVHLQLIGEGVVVPTAAWRTRLLTHTDAAALVIDDALLTAAERTLAEITADMQPGAAVHVVCHRGEAGDFDALVTAAEQCAQGLVAALAARNAQPPLRAFGAGPTAPAASGAQSRIEFVYPVRADD